MEFSEITKKYWTDADWQDLEKAESMNDMHVIAMRVIARMPRPIGQACGPISRWGLGSVKENLNVFNDAIKKLQNKGLNIFDQMPFELPMQDFKKRVPGEEGFQRIINDFYLPIFKSGEITTFYFMPTWQTSLGSKWEHEEAQKLGIKIEYI